MKNNQKIISNLGTVAGFITVCVLLSIFIPFPVKALETQPCLFISKLGRNISENTSWSETTNAKPSQTAGFSITVTASSNVMINSVTVDDVLPAKLEYISGSTKINGVSASDGITGSGIDIGGFSSNQSKTISFEAKIPDASQFSTGQNNLTNTAGAWAVCAAKVFDTAKIIVNKEEPSFPSLIISKSVDKTQASPNDEIIYTLNYQNIGNAAATDVIIKDIFDYTNQQYLTFVSAFPSPSSGNNTWNIGTLNAGQTGQIIIRAKISNSMPSGTTEIKNRGSIDSNETPFMYSNCANTSVSTVLSLSISKLGRNITEDSSWAEITNAKPFQKVAFAIKVTNTGNTTAKNVYVDDSLPYKLNYILDSTKVDGNSVSDGITLFGINVGDLSLGQYKTITLEANVASEYYFSIGQTTLINTGSTWTTNISRISDTAQIVVEKIGAPFLTITKSVNKTNANPGDEIVYTLNYQNTGNGAANNVVVKDPFTNQNQQYLTFVSATPSPTSGTDTWSIGTLNPGQLGSITIRAKICSSVPTGAIEIKNKTSIDSNETNSQDSNYVSTFVNTNVSLIIEKLVRNITKNSSFSKSVTADPEDEVEFSLKIKSTGNVAANNVKVWDDLPSRLNYTPGSTTVDGSYYNDGIIQNGINIGSLAPGQSKTVKFKAKVALNNKFNVGITDLTNYGYVEADVSGSHYDTAVVKVDKSSGCSPSLHIDKLVRNISQGYSYWTNSIYADSGDELEFIIKINSVGNEDAQNSKIRDNLPSELNYISGSTTVDGVYKSDDIFSVNGLSLGNLPIGAVREIKFNVKVASISNFSSSITTLTNTATTWCDKSCGEISDSAQILIKKESEGKILGVALIPTGTNLAGLMFLLIISCLIALLFYCRAREEKLLEALNSNPSNSSGRINKLVKAFIRFYFRIKFFLTVTKIRFKKVYW